MHRRRDHAGRRRSGHSREESVAARRHALNIEPRQTPRAATEIEKADQPAELDQVQCSGATRGCQRADAPGVGQKRGSHAEAHDVRERIELLSKLAVGAHGARDAPVQRIENNGDADGASGVVEIRRPPSRVARIA